MRELYKNNKESVDKVIAFAVFLAGIFVFFKFIAAYFAPFIFGYIIAIFLSPVSRLLQDRLKLPKGISALCAMLFLFLIVGTAGTFFVLKIIYEARVFFDNIPDYLKSVSDSLSGIQNSLEGKFLLLPDSVRTQLSGSLGRLIEGLASGFGSNVRDSSVGVVRGITKTVMVVVFGFISCFFIIKDKEEIDGFIVMQLPYAAQKRLSVIKTGLIDAVSGYVRAQLIMMLIIGCICAVSLTVLASPYALFLAAVIAFIDALPVFGSGAVFWPWAAYCIISGDYKKAVYIIIINIIVLLTRQVTEPRILGSQLGVNPLVTITAIYCGLRLFGFVGIVLGPMFVLIVKAMQEADLLPKWRHK